MAIRIVVAQEQGVLRCALRALLEKDPAFEVLGEVQNADDLLGIVQQTDAEALVLDCGMHRRCEMHLLRELMALKPKLSVVVLGMCEDEPCIHRFFSTGVRGYILKTSAEGELLNAIRATHRGEYYVDTSLADFVALPPPIDGAATAKQLNLLTEREQEVCRLLAYGYTNLEVAQKLDVSGRTIEAHRARIMNKLSLKTRAELVRFALRNGLLKPNPF